uniref:Uncharacterized protein n=1 Tax=Theileria annulata TaxID=5874 RepID=A0A3B0N4W0_THEAN
MMDNAGETNGVQCPVGEPKVEGVSTVTQEVKVQVKKQPEVGRAAVSPPGDKEDEYIPVVVRKDPGGGSTCKLNNY